MSRSARPLCAFGALVVFASSVIGETPDRPDLQKQNEEAALRQKGALAILEQALSNTRNLKLPQNRIKVETEILQLLWARDEARANGLLNQIVREFAQASSKHPGNSDAPNRLASLRQQRQQLVQFLGSADPQAALRFLAATRPYVRTESGVQEEAEERQIQLNLAAQQASQDPRLALQIAEKMLEESDDLPFELLNVLSTLADKDNSAATRLLREIVARLQQSDLTSDRQNFTFTVNLINMRASNPAEQDGSKEAEGSGKETEVFRPLAEAVAAAILSPAFPNEMMPNAEPCLPALAKFVPSQAQSLQEKLAESRQTVNPAQKSWDEFNQAQQNGSAEQLLSIAKQAPPDVSDSMYQQIASKLASEGDYARSRQVAEEDISDPAARNQVEQQGLQQAAAAALQRGQLALARQLIDGVTPEQARAVALVRLAVQAANVKKEPFALDLLTEADSLLRERPQNAEEFSGQMQLVEAFARCKPAHAVQLLDRSAKQVNQVLAAAAQVDGFVPTQASFEQGELVVSNSFLVNSLIEQYARAAASLADLDLETARNMADRIARPEARLMAEIAVARTLLNGNSGRVAYFRWGRHVTAFIQE